MIFSTLLKGQPRRAISFNAVKGKPSEFSQTVVKHQPFWVRQQESNVGRQTTIIIRWWRYNEQGNSSSILSAIASRIWDCSNTQQGLKMVLLFLHMYKVFIVHAHFIKIGFIWLKNKLGEMLTLQECIVRNESDFFFITIFFAKSRYSANFCLQIFATIFWDFGQSWIFPYF